MRLLPLRSRESLRADIVLWPLYTRARTLFVYPNRKLYLAAAAASAAAVVERRRSWPKCFFGFANGRPGNATDIDKSG